MAKPAAQRMREMRARRKMKDEERAKRLTAFVLSMPIYHATAAVINRIKTVGEIEENHDAVTRAIHYVGSLNDEALREAVKNP